VRIDGTVALVTGGASGLGEACVRSLISDGARVAFLDFDEQRGRSLDSELGDAACFYKTDITREDEVRSAVDKTVEVFGGIHVAVNCAGVGTPAKILGKKGLVPMDHFFRVINVNLIGTVHVIRLAAERMVHNEGNEDGEKGVIINTSSIAAFEGQTGQAAYSASKAAIVGLTLPVAREFAQYGLRMVTIAPGVFETAMTQGLSPNVRASLAEMIPFPRRLGRPWEFAHLVKQIIENPFLNGTTIRLDAALRMQAK